MEHAFRSIPSVAAAVPQETLADLARDPRIALIEEDGLMQMCELDKTWGLRRMKVQKVHDGTFASGAPRIMGRGVRVAVIDTGIDYTHPDLSANYRGGFDAVENDGSPFDDEGHGTHVAGSIAAVRDNRGVRGVAPEAELYGVKVLNSEGWGYWSWIVAGIEWSTKNKMDVANLSLSGSQDPGLAVRSAFASAEASGMVIVAAAGNSGSGTDTVGYPAKFPSTIAVGAITPFDERASFSSTGPDVELTAPGSGIHSTTPNGGYASWSGTSMAAPHVAGVAALLLSAGIRDGDFAAANGLRNDDVRAALAVTAQDLGTTGRDSEYGHGLVMADRAVAAACRGTGQPPIFDRPTRLAAKGVRGAVELTWRDNSNCEDGFRVQFGQWKNGRIVWGGSIRVPANTTSLRAERNPGTWYVRVRAFRDNPQSWTDFTDAVRFVVR